MKTAYVDQGLGVLHIVQRRQTKEEQREIVVEYVDGGKETETLVALGSGKATKAKQTKKGRYSLNEEPSLRARYVRLELLRVDAHFAFFFFFP